MKKLALLTVLVLTILQTNGQSYIPILAGNTKWMTIEQFTDPGNPNASYFFSKTNGDTIINSAPYTIIDRLDLPSCFLRENNGLVYCKYSNSSLFDTTEFLLYNFQLRLGDTMQLPSAGYELIFYPGIVTSVDSLLIGSSFHKRIEISGMWKQVIFIEGIGSMQGLFYQEIPMVDWMVELICFSRNDTIFSLDGTGTTYTGNCWQFVSVEETASSKLSIFPNPARDYIELSGQKILKTELYTINGQKIMETAFTKLNLQDFMSGIYFLRVYYPDNRIGNFKIIKE